MTNRKSLFLPALLTAALAPTPSSAGQDHESIVLADYAEGSNACVVIYDTEADQYLVHGLEQCMERLAPCSTFKIPNALIGLETGVLSGPGDLKEWDGTEHSRKVNNQDHDLGSAIENSVLWYFQDVALDVGPERMQAWLDRFDYGNRDISGGQARFWLGSSLQITAFEQIRFMNALDQGALPASPDNQQTVEDMMLQRKNLPDGIEGEVYGKTGSCVGKETDHGWFTGFYHRDGKRWVFAVNVKGKEQWGWHARGIALNVLNNVP